MITEFEFEPYVGALPLKFGMRPNEVLSLMKSNPNITKSYIGETEHDYGSVIARFSKEEDALVELSFIPKTSKLLFNKKDLFDVEHNGNPIKILHKVDPNIFETCGYLIFLNLGISVTGYHDDDEEQRSISVFKKGYWDDELDDARPWSN